MRTDVDAINDSLALTAATAHSKINGRFISGSTLRAGTARRSSTPGVIKTGSPKPSAPAVPAAPVPSKPPTVAGINAALREGGFKLSEKYSQQVTGANSRIAIGSIRVDGSGWKAQQHNTFGPDKLHPTEVQVRLNANPPLSMRDGGERWRAGLAAQTKAAREHLESRGFITKADNAGTFESPRESISSFTVIGRRVAPSGDAASRAPRPAGAMSRADVVAHLRSKGYNGSVSKSVAELNRIAGEYT